MKKDTLLDNPADIKAGDWLQRNSNKTSAKNVE
jgi:hypothetical protein